MESKGAVAYSAKIGRAWQVMEKMMRKHFLRIVTGRLPGGVRGPLGGLLL